MNWTVQDLECPRSAFITGLALSFLLSPLNWIYFDFFPCYYVEGKTVEFYADIINKLLNVFGFIKNVRFWFVFFFYMQSNVSKHDERLWHYTSEILCGWVHVCKALLNPQKEHTHKAHCNKDRCWSLIKAAATAQSNNRQKLWLTFDIHSCISKCHQYLRLVLDVLPRGESQNSVSRNRPVLVPEYLHFQSIWHLKDSI